MIELFVSINFIFLIYEKEIYIRYIFPDHFHISELVYRIRSSLSGAGDEFAYSAKRERSNKHVAALSQFDGMHIPRTGH